MSGSRTTTGLPMLANDPHLSASIPSIWYLAEIQGDQIHAIGATFPGLPAIVIGHNERVAWGVTNVGPDTQDLYIERINPANPNQYEVDGKWQDMAVVEETIVVDGEDQPLHWAARSTRHGPLISDVTTTGAPLALRWAALEPGDTTMDAFMGLNYAANWEQFVDALRLYISPSQNVVYADVDGNIGYYAPGRIPIRAEGHDGMLPVSGWDSSAEWTGYIPFDRLPHTYNPPAGFVATANNRVVGADYPYLISNDWAAALSRPAHHPLDRADERRGQDFDRRYGCDPGRPYEPAGAGTAAFPAVGPTGRRPPAAGHRLFAGLAGRTGPRQRRRRDL